MPFDSIESAQAYVDKWQLSFEHNHGRKSTRTEVQVACGLLGVEKAIGQTPGIVIAPDITVDHSLRDAYRYLLFKKSESRKMAEESSQIVSKVVPEHTNTPQATMNLPSDSGNRQTDAVSTVHKVTSTPRTGFLHVPPSIFKGSSECNFGSEAKSNIAAVPLFLVSKPREVISDVSDDKPKKKDLVSSDTLSTSKKVQSQLIEMRNRKLEMSNPVISEKFSPSPVSVPPPTSQEKAKFEPLPKLNTTALYLEQLELSKELLKIDEAESPNVKTEIAVTAHAPVEYKDNFVALDLRRRKIRSLRGGKSQGRYHARAGSSAHSSGAVDVSRNILDTEMADIELSSLPPAVDASMESSSLADQASVMSELQSSSLSRIDSRRADLQRSLGFRGLRSVRREAFAGRTGLEQEQRPPPSLVSQPDLNILSASQEAPEDLLGSLVNIGGLQGPDAMQELQRGPNGRPLCKHGVESRLRRVSKNGRNKGRSFFSCGASSGPADFCGFFLWREEDAGLVFKRFLQILHAKAVESMNETNLSTARKGGPLSEDAKLRLRAVLQQEADVRAHALARWTSRAYTLPSLQSEVTRRVGVTGVLRGRPGMFVPRALLEEASFDVLEDISKRKRALVNGGKSRPTVEKKKRENKVEREGKIDSESSAEEQDYSSVGSGSSASSSMSADSVLGEIDDIVSGDDSSVSDDSFSSSEAQKPPKRRQKGSVGLDRRARRVSLESQKMPVDAPSFTPNSRSVKTHSTSEETNLPVLSTHTYISVRSLNRLKCIALLVQFDLRMHRRMREREESVLEVMLSPSQPSPSSATMPDSVPALSSSKNSLVIGACDLNSESEVKNNNDHNNSRHDCEVDLEGEDLENASLLELDAIVARVLRKYMQISFGYSEFKGTQRPVHRATLSVLEDSEMLNESLTVQLTFQEWALRRCVAGLSSVLVTATGDGKSLCYQLFALLCNLCTSWERQALTCYGRRIRAAIRAVLQLSNKEAASSQEEEESLDEEIEEPQDSKKFGPGICIVVSPLLQLIEDQLLKLPPGIIGACLSSNTPADEVARTVGAMRDGRLHLLYVSPERIFSPSFVRLVRDPQFVKSISLLAVDEAHVISDWSFNFRPSYLRLELFLKKYIHPHSVLALTATASTAVIAHVREVLRIAELNGYPASRQLNDTWLSRSPRENLFFMRNWCGDPPSSSSANHSFGALNSDEADTLGLHSSAPDPPDTDKELALLQIVRSVLTEGLLGVPKAQSPTDSGISKRLPEERKGKDTGEEVTEAGLVIVYCLTQHDAERVAQFLSGRGLACMSYHAGMPAHARARAYARFRSGQVRVVAATSAFGMGIDLAHVRATLFLDCPRSIEDLVQQAGRAGRDGHPALAHLLLGRGGAEFRRLRSGVSSERSHWRQLAAFLVLLVCAVRRSILSGVSIISIPRRPVHWEKLISSELDVECPLIAICDRSNYSDTDNIMDIGSNIKDNLAHVFHVVHPELFHSTCEQSSSTSSNGFHFNRFTLSMVTMVKHVNLKREVLETLATYLEGMEELEVCGRAPTHVDVVVTPTGRALLFPLCRYLSLNCTAEEPENGRGADNGRGVQRPCIEALVILGALCLSRCATEDLRSVAKSAVHSLQIFDSSNSCSPSTPSNPPEKAILEDFLVQLLELAEQHRQLTQPPDMGTPSEGGWAGRSDAGLLSVRLCMDDLCMWLHAFYRSPLGEKLVKNGFSGVPKGGFTPSHVMGMLAALERRRAIQSTYHDWGDIYTLNPEGLLWHTVLKLCQNEVEVFFSTSATTPAHDSGAAVGVSRDSVGVDALSAEASRAMGLPTALYPVLERLYERSERITSLSLKRLHILETVVSNAGPNIIFESNSAARSALKTILRSSTPASTSSSEELRTDGTDVFVSLRQKFSGDFQALLSDAMLFGTADGFSASTTTINATEETDSLVTRRDGHFHFDWKATERLDRERQQSELLKYRPLVAADTAATIDAIKHVLGAPEDLNFIPVYPLRFSKSKIQLTKFENKGLELPPDPQQLHWVARDGLLPPALPSPVLNGLTIAKILTGSASPLLGLSTWRLAAVGRAAELWGRWGLYSTDQLEEIANAVIHGIAKVSFDS